MSVLIDEKIDEKLAMHKARKMTPKRSNGYLWLSKLMGIPDGTLKHWIHFFRIPVIKKNGKVNGQIQITKENVEAIHIVHELLYIEQYTMKGAKRQLEKRGLLDGKHFLKV